MLGRAFLVLAWSFWKGWMRGGGFEGCEITMSRLEFMSVMYGCLMLADGHERLIVSEPPPS